VTNHKVVWCFVYGVLIDALGFAFWNDADTVDFRLRLFVFSIDEALSIGFDLMCLLVLD